MTEHIFLQKISMQLEFACRWTISDSVKSVAVSANAWQLPDFSTIFLLLASIFKSVNNEKMKRWCVQLIVRDYNAGFPIIASAKAPANSYSSDLTQ